MAAILLKLDDALLAAWRARAKSAGMSVSAWIRLQCGEGLAEDRQASVVLIAKPGAGKVNRKTGHAVDCECFTCVQHRRFRA